MLCCYIIASSHIVLYIFFSYIAKSDTIETDLNFIIRHKLMGDGTTVHLNIMRDTVDNKNGRYLPLFSKLENQTYWISKISELYREDMKLFGYSYFANGKDLYATCKHYDSYACK